MSRTTYTIEEEEGGHGGGDPIMLNDCSAYRSEDPLNRAASHIDGAMSILTGIAGNISIIAPACRLISTAW